MADGNLAPIEISVRDLLDPVRRASTLAAAITAMHVALGAGRDTVVYTSRELVTAADAAGVRSRAGTVRLDLAAAVKKPVGRQPHGTGAVRTTGEPMQWRKVTLTAPDPGDWLAVVWR